MKAGGDKDGIWTILESGLQYVAVPRASSVCFSPFFSISAILSHVPYVIGFMMSTVGGGPMRPAIKFGQRSVLKRLEAGANKKDLFYYLVRQYTLLRQSHFIEAKYRVARNFPRPSAPLSMTLPKMGCLLLLLVRIQQAAFLRRLSITCYSIRQRMNTYREKLTVHFQVEKNPWTV